MKHGPYRLPAGGLIDRSRPIEFTFDGHTLQGYAGDTVASALLANCVRIVARSFKFHRPRGVYSAGVEEPNALVRLHSGARALPSVRATLVPLVEGLQVRSQSGWPDVSWDVLRTLDLVAPLFAAGFYNKTFMWPGWHTYEPLIRRLAGLGQAPRDPDPDRYDTRNAHCDVLVVGGGVAGIRAALEAARARQRVLLVDSAAEAGGRARWDGSVIDDVPAGAWLAASLQELRRCADVQLMTNTLAAGCYDHNVVTLVESCEPGGSVERATARPRERFWVVRTRRLVLATGRIEQPLVFANNDRPGVMLAGAARQYLALHAIAPGRRIVIATNNDSVYALASELYRVGIPPLAVLDSRAQPPQEHAARMQALSIPLHAGFIPLDTLGFGTLGGISFGRVAADASVSHARRLACDALLVSGGWNPALQLFAQAGGKLTYCEHSLALEAAGPLDGIDIVGSAGSASHAGNSSNSPPGPRIARHGATARQWVDLLHDVTVADLELAIRENFVSIEHVKRYTTVGMSVDQGKTATPLSLEIVARLRGCAPADLGYTTQRPLFFPVSLGAIAGRGLGERFAPSRVTPLHAWHVSAGALLRHYGEWQRPAAYPQPGETRTEAMRREARAVRTRAALFDASPLGKIEIRGPDAHEFIDRFYINDLRTLRPMHVRYGLMLRESGVIYDDGTVVAIAPDRILITTTSGNANSVAAWLQEWHQCEWPTLRVTVSPVTDQWATVTVAGPLARTVLERLGPACDLSNAAFPHFGLRETTLLGTPVRICRVSYNGELTYEINVPPDSARETWEALMHAGRDVDIVPYGIDAVMLLRLEKGYLHVGTDTDGTTVPDDVGWGRAAAAKTGDFVGKRSLQLPEHRRVDRLQLVGLRGQEVALPVGSHLRFLDSREVTDGWVTSTGTGVLDGMPIALAMLRGGRSRPGSRVLVHDAGRTMAEAIVTAPVFYDAAGERLHA